jgi:hypothetical protein
VLFFLAFLTVGMVGAQTLAATFETVRSEYLGASAFLLLLCLAASIISTVCYAVSSEGSRSHPEWYTGLFGGLVAAGAFAGSIGAGYAGPGFGGLGLALALMLPGLLGWFWPVLGRKVRDG